jgi:poly(ADP-ribose) glycohydrolase ARH3
MHRISQYKPSLSDLESKYLGSMNGSALGDAIGELAFHYRSEEGLRDLIPRLDSLIYTDDTAMAIGLTQSLVSAGGLNEQHLRDTFRANYRREPWRGYASGPPTIFAEVERQGIPYAEAAQSLFGGQGSFGNGAAMRIAPVGLLYHDSLELYEKAQASACVTHTHSVGVDGAAIKARAVAHAVRLEPTAPFPVALFCRDLLAFARTPEMQSKIELLDELVSQEAPASVAAQQLGKGSAVHESLPFALFAFCRHPDDYEICLFCSILDGGDRDTLGAMACAISGAYLGIEAIPREWRAQLENRNLIESLSSELLELRLRRA